MGEREASSLRLRRTWYGCTGTWWYTRAVRVRVLDALATEMSGLGSGGADGEVDGPGVGVGGQESGVDRRGGVAFQCGIRGKRDDAGGEAGERGDSASGRSRRSSASSRISEAGPSSIATTSWFG
uniref:Uncharacterized protein n=1 Tax=Physcomitrium patens TaxID=3218 RepID=A0A2K1L6V5_PHYPA|nr:hypothetical protein PHYPA_000191 [Physcomitrium patens]